jgi:hypothetical protein
MRHRRPTWQDHDPEHVVTWVPAEPPVAVEGPLALDLFCDRLLVLELAPSQVALLEVDGQIQRAYLDQGQQLDVGAETGQTEPRGRLIFVRSDVPIAWRWGDGAELHVDVGGGQSIDLPLRGQCAIAADDPVRFFRTVLAGLESLPVERLQNILDTLVRAQLERRLGELVEHAGLDRMQAEVMLENLAPADLDEDLAELGLACGELNLFVGETTSPDAAELIESAPVYSYDDVL